MTNTYNAIILMIIAIHLTWIFVISMGSLLAISGKLRTNTIAETGYLVVVGFTVINRILSPNCWLTLAELHFRSLVEGSVISYGFIDHYLGIVGFSIGSGLLFFISAAWIGAGLIATMLYHAIDRRAGQSFRMTAEA